MTTNEPPQYPGDSGDSTPSEPSSTPPDASSTSGAPSYGSTEPPAGETPPSAPPPPPPPAPGGSAEGFSAPDAIGWGWRKFTENVGPILIGVLIVIVVSIVVGILAGIVSGGGTTFGPGGATADFSIAGLLANLVSTAVSIVLGAVFARAALDVVDGRAFDFPGAFGRINIVNVIIAAVLVSILVTIGFILLVIPGIVALFLTYFTTLYIVDDDATSPVTAISDSVKLISSNVGDALLLALLNVLVLIAGAIALLVGLVVAYPVTALASAYAYRRFRGQPTAT
jgi:uncharacterized membrane protein